VYVSVYVCVRERQRQRQREVGVGKEICIKGQKTILNQVEFLAKQMLYVMIIKTGTKQSNPLQPQKTS
jgi:hypothetical protein